MAAFNIYGELTEEESYEQERPTKRGARSPTTHD